MDKRRRLDPLYVYSKICSVGGLLCGNVCKGLHPKATIPYHLPVLTKLYLDKATLVWNGNAVSGQAALAEFFEMLPSSDFQVTTFDCQPVHEQATQNHNTILVVTCGSVKFDGSKQQYFNQNFLLTAQTTNNNTVWKIASDCFRFQDCPN
ncbi:NTF2-related export protein 2 isoform X2 [Lacerta agilis]|nr:NTF2-related export protein 2 isoform X2 [Lacerta agilis]